MVIVPAGAFMMGSPDSEVGRFEDEGPVREVAIAREFAVSKYPVTRADYAAFAAETGAVAQGCAVVTDEGWKLQPALTWEDAGFRQSDDHPVVCVSWDDAQAYATWLSNKTGKRYRLLTEAEFEYAARAGSSSAHSWAAGAEACQHANGFDASAKKEHPDWNAMSCDDGYAHTSPVGAFPANAFGLHDMSGNVFQWTEDCYAEDYESAPVNGQAYASGECVMRVIRGGSWLNSEKGLRSAQRDHDRPTDRYTNVGIRLAREL